MGNIFSASEVLEIAIQIEKNGREFYETLAKNTKNEERQRIFSFLAQEEGKHQRVFLKIKEGLEEYPPQGLDADQYYKYMNALASESVFTQKEKAKEIAKNAKSEEEAIDIGIQAEKDSIKFYTAIKKVVPEYEIKAVDEVIRNEEEHLEKLQTIKSLLKR